MRGPTVKLLPKVAGILENAGEDSREALGVEGELREESLEGWVLADTGTFYAKTTFEEVDRNWEGPDAE